MDRGPSVVGGAPVVPAPGIRAPRLLTVALAAALLVPLAAPTLIQDREPLASRALVRFVPGVSAAAQERVLSAHGADIVSRIPELDLVVANLTSVAPDRAILGLFSEPEVLGADLDRTRTATGSFGARAEDAGWALRRSGAPKVDPSGFATLAILDTGVDVRDPNLTGQLMQGWSAFGTDPLTDENGHGTALARIAAGSATDGDAFAGIAPRGLLVLPIQVLTPSGSGRDSDVVAGIVEAVDRGADVILLGLAGTGYSGALQAAVEYAWTSGAVLVAPVGDGDAQAPSFPAGNAGVMGVAATTAIDTRSSSSNRGPSVFLAAPGFEVPVGSDRTFSGTAASAAIVAAGAGLLAAADVEASNAAIVGRLARTADPVGPRTEVGNGRVDLTAALAERSEAGIAPNGVLNGEGGPFVTTYRDGAAPLAGWARERAAFFGDQIFPITGDGLAVPVLTSSTGSAPAMTFWHWSVVAVPTADGQVLRRSSFLVGSLFEDPLASDHGAFTYGSVSPPAVEYGVLS